jgi:hypothetical protein
MRTGVRIFLAAAVVATLAGMGWVGGLYYWHFRVEKVIRYVEDGGAEGRPTPEMETTLHEAGCRALPDLMRETRPDRPANFLNFTTSWIVETLNREPVTTRDVCDLRMKRREEYRVERDDSEKVRAAKVTRLREWWAAHGAEVHQWWRFWSGNCRYSEE